MRHPSAVVQATLARVVAMLELATEWAAQVGVAVSADRRVAWKVDDVGLAWEARVALGNRKSGSSARAKVGYFGRFRRPRC